ncbi:MAG: PorP/SprF family type IX secretion system membrane protein [Bacteroidota bacterium]
MLKRLRQAVLGLLLAIFCLSADETQAQELVFSQIHRQPLLLNPALTGHIEGNYRFILLYRQQGLNVGSNPVYQTPSVSADFNVGGGPHTWGIGLSVTNDISAGGALNDLMALASLAFHLSIDQKSRHYISLGFQGGLRQLRLKPNELSFGEQFSGIGFDPNLSNGESFDRTQSTNAELRTGVTWSTYTEGLKIILGGAYFNFLEPETGFMEGAFRTATIAGHAQFRIRAGKRFWFEPEAVYFQQSGVDHYNAGALLAFKGKEGRSGFSFGLFYRSEDALVPRVEIQVKDWLIGFSFDRTISELNTVNNGAGAIEASLRFQGKVLKTPDAVLPAIRFH